MQLKVGELAARTGVSVRTLHHYEDIGLLKPSGRTASGHRLYDAADVERLLRIRALRQLGVGLEAVERCLVGPDGELGSVLRRRLDAVTAELEVARRLRQRLERLLAALDHQPEANVDVLLDALEAMTMFEKYYTEDQLERLAERREALGPEALAAAQQEWARLITAARAELEAGRLPTDPSVAPLARRWQELLAAFSGGDDAILQSTAQMYQHEPGAMEKMGLDPALLEFMGRAMAAL
jgi:MerR family transcriptional regulator, thiopeptide resistance regulator